MICEKCGSQIAYKSKFCPDCGAKQETEQSIAQAQRPFANQLKLREGKKLYMRWWFWAIVVVLLLFCALSDGTLQLVIGFAGVPVCLVILIIKAIRKKSVKTTSWFMAAFFVCFIWGGFTIPEAPPAGEASPGPAVVQNAQVGTPNVEDNAGESQRIADENAEAERKAAEEAAEKERLEQEEKERAETEAAEAAIQDEASFKSECVSVDYKELLRYPENYIGQKVVLTVKIYQVMSTSFLNASTAYRCYSDTSGYGFYMDDEYYISDGRGDGAVKLLDEDIITIYGTFEGTREITRAIGRTNSELPEIKMLYADLIE